MSNIRQFTNIPFEFTWCDYLTPCPHRPNIMVGDYDCCNCANYVSSRQESFKYDKQNDNYKNYGLVLSGVVFCKFKK